MKSAVERAILVAIICSLLALLVIISGKRDVLRVQFEEQQDRLIKAEAKLDSITCLGKE